MKSSYVRFICLNPYFFGCVLLGLSSDALAYNLSPSWYPTDWQNEVNGRVDRKIWRIERQDIDNADYNRYYEIFLSPISFKADDMCVTDVIEIGQEEVGQERHVITSKQVIKVAFDECKSVDSANFIEISHVGGKDEAVRVARVVKSIFTDGRAQHIIDSDQGIEYRSAFRKMNLGDVFSINRETSDLISFEISNDIALLYVRVWLKDGIVTSVRISEGSVDPAPL